MRRNKYIKIHVQGSMLSEVNNAKNMQKEKSEQMKTCLQK